MRRISFVEKNEYREEFGSISVPEYIDIGFVVKHMNLDEIAETDTDVFGGRYIVTSAPLTSGQFESNTYQVYRDASRRISEGILFSICSRFENNLSKMSER